MRVKDLKTMTENSFASLYFLAPSGAETPILGAAVDPNDDFVFIGDNCPQHTETITAFQIQALLSGLPDHSKVFLLSSDLYYIAAAQVVRNDLVLIPGEIWLLTD